MKHARPRYAEITLYGVEVSRLKKKDLLLLVEAKQYSAMPLDQFKEKQNEIMAYLREKCQKIRKKDRKKAAKTNHCTTG